MPNKKFINMIPLNMKTINTIKFYFETNYKKDFEEQYIMAVDYIKLYVCDECGRPSSRKDNLKRHYNTFHSNIKPEVKYKPRMTSQGIDIPDVAKRSLYSSVVAPEDPKCWTWEIYNKIEKSKQIYSVVLKKSEMPYSSYYTAKRDANNMIKTFINGTCLKEQTCKGTRKGPYIRIICSEIYC